MNNQRTRTQERAMLRELVDEFSNEMLARLYEKLEAGYTGWDDWTEVSDRELCVDLERDAILCTMQGDRFHLPDIANRAAFLWWRKWRKEKCPV